MQQKEFLLQDEQSPLIYFKNLTTRILFRNSSEYVALLNESFHPRLLFNEKERDEYFNWLSQSEYNIAAWKIIALYEKADLIKLDIPYFTTQSSSTKIFSSQGESIPITVRQTGWQRLVAHLSENFNEEDLYLQQHIIDNSFNAWRLNEEARLKAHKKNQRYKKLDLLATKNSNHHELQQRALVLAKQSLAYLNHIKMVDNQQAIWPNIQQVQQLSSSPSITDIDLYHGNAGIVLPFIYAADLLDNDEYRQTVLQAINFIEKRIISYQQNQKLFPKLNGIGAFGGITAALYTYAVLSKRWQLGSALESIQRILRLTASLIEKDDWLDVLSGCAGTLCNLLLIREVVVSPQVDELCHACVKHILTQFPQPMQQPLNKRYQDYENPLLGMAHGASGILLA